eukprot:4372546-Pyramimonas_sp.AAC.1
MPRQLRVFYLIEKELAHSFVQDLHRIAPACSFVFLPHVEVRLLFHFLDFHLRTHQVSRNPRGQTSVTRCRVPGAGAVIVGATGVTGGTPPDEGTHDTRHLNAYQ